mmetsp:Transcript_22525/g.40593  ORF Transcript_22525/g.40593 Transcript_22525/m.40593 type:complete len:704 (+) Transcript_22525:100-2211(+)|eukprot:CAMPEP_0204905630 /NCGR_PEP_ID=MMETSP1397-20131031/5524_1 /ASSEMBLY_ACC=CAM_ASM_000891 /TAXON_ID=49980 /ORGANISM="Climacostomum Climacostomum virens, Strain Stock W-24" /LENGTH=703 /DNA_ID=CAMNT_0052074537 /DNA_START=1 /DNA_END=2112 /DNA_ORIENTATION=+
MRSAYDERSLSSSSVSELSPSMHSVILLEPEKIRKVLKKNKALDKIFKNLRKDQASASLKEFMSQREQLETVLKNLTLIDPNLICPLSKSIIKKSAFVLSQNYEMQAIKEYILKNNALPDGKLINLASFSDPTAFHAVVQANPLFDASTSKYVNIKLANIITLLNTGSDELMDEQKRLTEILVLLIVHADPRSGVNPILSELVKALDPYSELTMSLLQELPSKWGESAIEQVSAIVQMTNPHETLNFLAACYSCLAKLYETKGSYNYALQVYGQLYDIQLGDLEDWKKHSELLIKYDWSPACLGRFNCISFHEILLKSAEELNRNDVIIETSLALSNSSNSLERKVEYLYRVLQIDFENPTARPQMHALAEKISVSPNCQMFIPMLIEVLKSYEDYTTIAKLYHYLQPAQLLNHPGLIPLVGKINNTLEEMGSNHFAVETSNLLADLYFQLEDYKNSAIWTEHVLDRLDEYNAPSMNRLSSLSEKTKQLYLEMKYQVRNLLKTLHPNVPKEQIDKANEGIGQIIKQFENKVDGYAKGSGESDARRLEKQLADLQQANRGELKELRRQSMGHVEELKSEQTKCITFIQGLQQKLADVEEQIYKDALDIPVASPPIHESEIKELKSNLFEAKFQIERQTEELQHQKLETQKWKAQLESSQQQHDLQIAELKGKYNYIHAQLEQKYEQKFKSLQSQLDDLSTIFKN